MGVERQATVLLRQRPTIGTFDEASPEEQMQAIDLAMRYYFDAVRWLEARDKLFPGLRRKGS